MHLESRFSPLRAHYNISMELSSRKLQKTNVVSFSFYIFSETANKKPSFGEILILKGYNIAALLDFGWFLSTQLHQRGTGKKTAEGQPVNTSRRTGKNIAKG